MSYSVAQNTTWLTAASIVQKIISFAYFTLVARLIGVGNTGQYFFAISFTTIFTVVADFGLGPVLTREAAKHTERSEEYINTIFWTKIIFGIGAYALVVFFINLLNYHTDLKQLVYLSGVTMFFDNLQSTFYSLFRARKNLVYESWGIIGSQFITLVIGTTALVLKAPLIWLIAAYTIPSFLNVLYAGWFARRVFGLRYRFYFDAAIFKTFTAIALPFALAGFIGRLYSYIDTILMSKMLCHAGEACLALGWWSVPYKITFAFQFIPAALSASVYPVFSTLTVTEPAKLPALFAQSWRYLGLIVLPLAVGLGVLAKPVILLLNGKAYLPSVLILQILLASLVFGFLSFITGAFLNATNRQTTQTALLGFVLVTNIILNVIFLPRWGVVGAAWAALFGNILLCGGGFYFCRRVAPIQLGELASFALKIIWPTAAMASVVYGISQRVHFLLSIPVGIVVYMMFLFVSKALDWNMLRNFYSKVRV